MGAERDRSGRAVGGGLLRCDLGAAVGDEIAVAGERARGGAHCRAA